MINYYVQTCRTGKLLILKYEVSYKLQFRAARKVAEEIGAQIVLGDRPIEITVRTIRFVSLILVAFV